MDVVVEDEASGDPVQGLVPCHQGQPRLRIENGGQSLSLQLFLEFLVVSQAPWCVSGYCDGLVSLAFSDLYE